jgi:hypothetical protein
VGTDQQTTRRANRYRITHAVIVSRLPFHRTIKSVYRASNGCQRFYGSISTVVTFIISSNNGAYGIHVRNRDAAEVLFNRQLNTQTRHAGLDPASSLSGWTGDKKVPPIMQTEFQKSRKSFAPFAFRQCWLPAAAAAAALILWSCIATPPPGDPISHRLRIDTIWAGRQCGCEARQPQVRWVTDPDQLTAAMAAAVSSDLKMQVARHPVDWKQEGMVWIDMGLKPSGGYALSLAAPTAAVSAGVAVITVRWRHPRPGSVVTQQLTSPCLVLKLPQSNFHTIEIEDESGRVHASVEVNED